MRKWDCSEGHFKFRNSNFFSFSFVRTKLFCYVLDQILFHFYFLSYSFTLYNLLKHDLARMGGGGGGDLGDNRCQPSYVPSSAGKWKIIKGLKGFSRFLLFQPNCSQNLISFPAPVHKSLIKPSYFHFSLIDLSLDFASCCFSKSFCPIENFHLISFSPSAGLLAKRKPSLSCHNRGQQFTVYRVWIFLSRGLPVLEILPSGLEQAKCDCNP